MPVSSEPIASPRELRLRYKLALMVPLFAVATLWAPALMAWSDWLEDTFGVPHGQPIGDDHPDKWLYVTIAFASCAVALIAIVVLGWLLGAAFARWVLDWPPEKVRAVFRRREFPDHWRKPLGGPLTPSEVGALSRDEATLGRDLLRRVLRTAVLASAAFSTMFFGLLMLRWNGEFTLTPVLWLLVRSVATGVGIGVLVTAFFWIESRRATRLLEERKRLRGVLDPPDPSA